MKTKDLHMQTKKTANVPRPRKFFVFPPDTDEIPETSFFSLGTAYSKEIRHDVQKEK